MELKQYLDPLRKWWWLLLAAAAIAAASGFYTASQQPPVYRAQTSLTIGSAIDNPNPVGNEIWLGQQLAQTYVELAKGASLQQSTQTALGMTWLPEYTVRNVPNTLLIQIVVNDTNPERVAAVANELANQLINRTPSSASSAERGRQVFIETELNDLEAQITSTKAGIERLQGELGDLYSARQISDTQNEIRALEAKLNTQQSNYAALLANTQRGAINQLNITEWASVPANPVGPNRNLPVLSAAAIGLVLAAGAAYLLEYLDDSVKSAEELAELAGAPTLVAIPRIKGAGSGEHLVALNQPRAYIAEAYRTLRTGIQFSVIDSAHRHLLITSARPSEGKSITAANLATVFAQSDARVLLIDTDLRRPKQHRLFDVPNHTGMTTLLMRLLTDRTNSIDTSIINEAVQPTKQQNLYVLTTGPLPPNPSELLGSDRMQLVIDALAEQFDYLLFDTPPTLAVTDAVVLSQYIHNVLMVVRHAETRRTQVKQVAERFSEVNAKLLGCVLNNVSRDSKQYYYDYYHAEPEQDADGGSPPSSKRLLRGFTNLRKDTA